METQQPFESRRQLCDRFSIHHDCFDVMSAEPDFPAFSLRPSAPDKFSGFSGGAFKVWSVDAVAEWLAAHPIEERP